jgi:hypothetical protein
MKFDIAMPKILNILNKKIFKNKIIENKVKLKINWFVGFFDIEKK